MAKAIYPRAQLRCNSTLMCYSTEYYLAYSHKESRPKVGASSASSVSSEEGTEETEKSQVKLGAHAPYLTWLFHVISLTGVMVSY